MESNEYGVLVADGSSILRRGDSYLDLKAAIEFSVSASEARILKPNLGIAMVCTISAPKVYGFFDTLGATVASPIELELHRLLVPVTVTRSWLGGSRECDGQVIQAGAFRWRAGPS
jgi:hypothetical protein